MVLYTRKLKMLIAVVNHSTLVTDSDVQIMAQACAHQIRYHLSPVWGRSASVIYFASDAIVPPGAHIISILDNSDQAGALGWHTEDAGESIYGRVFAKPVLDNGGNALTASLSIASVLSHEICEMIGDQSCNLWAEDASGNLHAVELCDPVEAASYIVTIGATQVTVSDFVLPSWFDPDAKVGGIYSYMNRVHAPFTLDTGGYEIWRSGGGNPTQKFGESYPEWKLPGKTDSLLARSAKRLKEPTIESDTINAVLKI